MTQKIVIAGSGFAGMWAAISAARALSIAGKESAAEITVVSPEANLHIRPRLYETVFSEMAPPLSELFEAVGVKHFSGVVDKIHADRREIEAVAINGERCTLSYDRFILATGSRLFMPDVPGLKEHGFNVDQLGSAIALDAHLKNLATRPDTAARNTVIVAGGGFTGIETASEMPARLREIFGADTKIRVVVLEQASAIGPDLGPGPRPVIEKAFAELGVETLIGTAVTSIDAGGVTTSTGERIESNTVVWTAGARANVLAEQLPGQRDRFGRLSVTRELKAQGVEHVFVTGDVAFAATDDDGNHTMMSCQHAVSLGRLAGHNAAAELVGLPKKPYSQPKYVTCLDLGPWGAVYTEGWDRQIKLVGDEAKALKRDINTKWIYPPRANREEAFAAADPDFVVVA